MDNSNILLYFNTFILSWLFPASFLKIITDKMSNLEHIWTPESINLFECGQFQFAHVGVGLRVLKSLPTDYEHFPGL